MLSTSVSCVETWGFYLAVSRSPQNGATMGWDAPVGVVNGMYPAVMNVTVGFVYFVYETV